MTRRLMTGAVLLAALAGPAAAAEPDDRPITEAVARLSFEHTDGALGGDPPRVEARSAARRDALPQRQAYPGTERSKGARIGRRIAGAAVGAVGGAFAGGYLGAAIDGDCGGCDDPGFKGFLIGFPVGGVVGGVLGGLFLFR
jgi:hypothetical protein